jgi:1-aminocyclopropane-1-carboxylate deaminase/D-cysteine desulfhydrase-like pyridoxal-dependent ACC family enzyme
VPESHAYPIFEALPRLRQRAPVAGLLAAATPVQPLEGARVWLKRDDLTAPDYGGNKVRKLDFLLAGALEAGARELVCFGYAGSNFVAATAWHGRKLGLSTLGFLLPQVPADYVADNLAVSLHCGAELRLRRARTGVAAAALARSARSLLLRGRHPFWIPPGGSSPAGVLGFVNAALELARQVRDGELPEPDFIYVPFSSMGTVAGLAIGAVLAGLGARIMAVQVVDAGLAGRAKLATLIAATLRELGEGLLAVEPVLERVTLRTEFYGGEYARATPAARSAIVRFQAGSGARADSAYSGKALAALYADLDAGLLKNSHALYWHTFNRHGRPAEVRLPRPGTVPRALRRYFEAPLSAEAGHAAQPV